RTTTAKGKATLGVNAHGEVKSMADDDYDFWKNWHRVWWGHLIIAAFLLGLALLVYWYISGVESRGGGRVHWIVALVYNGAGKAGTVLLFAIPGGILLVTGLWKLFARTDDTD
ncbi:MAG: hypothetical protein L0Z62_39765, partial [Gemmataceae bacterium]|nr:hypothetical protein [Gemmataceae bacterium]